jgi:DNA-binding MarR family transcriptional regulator
MDEQQSDPGIARVSALAGELHVLLGKLKRRLREEAHAGDFTWSQTSVLVRLERDGPATVTTLARAEGVRPQSMGATIAVLEAAGLVRGAPDPADGRQTILSLTDTCRDMIRAGRAAREEWLSRAIQAELSAVELEQLATGIELLKRLVD